MLDLHPAGRPRGASLLMPPHSFTIPGDEDPRDRDSNARSFSNGDRSDATGLTGLRVFIAEDEFLVAVMLEQDLRSLGCQVVGPFTSLALAIQASRREDFDVAVLDVNMNGEMVYPLADELLARGRPFLFLTGYGTANLPERYRASPRLSKPYDLTMLTREIRRMLGRERSN